MRSIRAILAGVLGGAVMFIWGAVSHMVLPIGEMGVRSLPPGADIVPAMKQSIHERGFYFFPPMPEGDASEAAKKAWEEQLRQGPQGVVIYDPSGSGMITPQQLGTEYASSAVAALLAAIILGSVAGSWLRRTMMATLIGVTGWASIVVSYWTWYRFPDAFAIGQLLDQGIGWLLSGAILAAVAARPKSAKAPAAMT